MKKCYCKSIDVANPEIPQKEKEALREALEISGKPIAKNTKRWVMYWLMKLVAFICFIGLFL